eukprot:scaffold40315_cov226-Skeletonema_marinoi.AAC.2
MALIMMAGISLYEPFRVAHGCFMFSVLAFCTVITTCTYVHVSFTIPDKCLYVRWSVQAVRIVQQNQTQILCSVTMTTITITITSGW